MKINNILKLGLLVSLPGAATAGLDSYVDLQLRTASGDKEAAKAREYSDYDHAYQLNLGTLFTKGSYFVELAGENAGNTDQSYVLQGGTFGKMKYSFMYNELPHYISLNAKTPWRGIGTGSYTLGNTVTNTPISTWTGFDYKIDKKTMGADFSYKFESPFFINFGANKVEQDGYQAVNGSSANAEMPELVNYDTVNITAETGFVGEKYSVILSGLVSKFQNNSQKFMWRNTANSGNDFQVGFDDNSYMDLNLDGIVKDLPLHSTLSLALGYSELKSDFDLSENLADSSTTNVYTFSSKTYNGELKYYNAKAAWSFAPLEKLHSKLYAKHRQKDNKSNKIEIGWTGGNTVDNELFGYKKTGFGLDNKYDLNDRNDLVLNYENQKVKREARHDALSTTDNVVKLGWVNTSFDFLKSDLSYTRTMRSSEFGNGSKGEDIVVASNAGNAEDASDAFYRFVRRFDATDKTEDRIAADFELFLNERLDLSVGAAYKMNDYDETKLGVTEDSRKATYVDAGYSFANKIRVSANADYENTQVKAYHRYAPRPTTAGGTIDPNPNHGTVCGATPGTATSCSYNWATDTHTETMGVGANVSVPLLSEKIKVDLGGRYEENNGKVDFTAEHVNATVYDVGNYDDFKKKVGTLKVAYNHSENLEGVIGYRYERFVFSDDSTNNYNNKPSANIVYSGAGADRTYNLNVAYTGVTYRF